MIELSKGMRVSYTTGCLNTGFRSDLRWQSFFLPIWNGSCPLSSISLGVPSVELTSDASGSWGCGVHSSHGQWFSCSSLRAGLMSTSQLRNVANRPRSGSVGQQMAETPGLLQV